MQRIAEGCSSVRQRSITVLLVILMSSMSILKLNVFLDFFFIGGKKKLKGAAMDLLFLESFFTPLSSFLQ